MNPPSEFKGGKDEIIQICLSQIKDYLDLNHAEWKEWVPIAVTFLKGAAYEWWFPEVRLLTNFTGWDLKHCLMRCRTNDRRSIG